MSKRKSITHHGVKFERTADPALVIEKALAERWERENNPKRNPPLLCAIMNHVGYLAGISFVGEDPKHNLGMFTERDAKIAASVIQWIGTNFGRHFLEEAFREAGYELTIHKKTEQK